MKQIVSNPFLPLWEYVPDGEPHVFGDRVYLYGSHDKAASDRFCVEDYTVWSAPVNDLSDWTCHGVAYRKSQDPRCKDGKLVDLYAPDCVQGNDGRYYLYYFAAGPDTDAFGPMSVAVSDRPEGPFDYLGDIRYPDGRPVLDYLTNDPAVLNDNGRIWFYYGWGLGRDFRSRILKPLYEFVLSKLCNRTLKQIKESRPSILSCAVVELEEDMMTVKTKPKAVLDSKTTAAKNSELYHHPFYEAASIRKFNDLYYLVYSSGENNELAYATSKYPDRGFVYRGVIVSNSDLGYQGNRSPKNNSGTIHGGIEYINGQSYIFYHRCTNNTDFSRQACGEPISIEEDGTIRQVEITSQGLYGKALPGIGTYPAAICCNLITAKPISLGLGKQQKMPRIAERNNETILVDLTAETKAVYKYFDLRNTGSITVDYTGNGVLAVNGRVLDDHFSAPLSGGEKETLTFELLSGKLDIRSFCFKEA
ncbi:MAG: family 43 glycosylhydrolase [Erysipelotrichaceae bacterium]|nr:family 43 glycosylhydrolase [Erysipelotrichaceae bacterium]